MPSISNLHQKGALKWHPDADAVNAPEGSLLVGTNLVPDKSGSLTVRKGSTEVYADMGTDVSALYTAELNNGTTYRACQVDDKILLNNVEQGSFEGTGDIAMGDDTYQMFFARGTTRKKWDGTNWYNWSIPPPAAAPTLAAVTAISTTVADFNDTESPACTITEGTGDVGLAADQAGNATEATTMTPSTTSYQGILQRLFTTDQDYNTLSGTAGSETDLIDLYVKFASARNVESIKVVFGLNDSSTIPFRDDRFEFEFDIQGGKDIPMKDLPSESAASYSAAVSKSVSGVSPQEVSGIRSPDQVKATLASVGDVDAPKAAAPKDDAWGHLTITRGQFTRIGSTAARGWNTVRGLKIIYKLIKGKTGTLTISDCKIIGGGDRSLTGTFRCVIRGVRDNGTYYEMSPPSAESSEINLNHQTLQITIGGSTLSALDKQCDQIWVYLFGGWLDGYYRFAVTASEVKTGMTIDELTSPDGADFGDADERTRITTWGHTVHDQSASSDIVITLRTSELDALTDNIRLEPYQIECPNNVVDIAGPWMSRMFVLTSEGYVYPSSATSPGSFNSLQMVDLTRYGDPLWMAKTGNGIYVGMEKDVVFLAGSGDESPDRAAIDLYGQPLNVGNPPIDACHIVYGNSIIYRSNDGLMELTGSNLRPIPTNGTSLLWRGVERHGVKALNVTTGRFRMAIDNHMLYMLAPEGTSTTAIKTIYRFGFESQQWSRLFYEQMNTEANSIFCDPDGSLLVGDGGGSLWKIESGTQDEDNAIPVEVLTPIEDGGQPLTVKDAFDLQLHTHTGGKEATVYLYKDGNATETTSYSATTTQPSVWRTSLSGFGSFTKAQMKIEGDFNAFVLNQWNLAYRPRPQRVAYLDTGYFTNQGDLSWIQEIELDVNPAGDLTVELYFNDTLHSSHSVSVNADVRDVYQLPMARDAKGERPRIVVKSDTTYGTTTGFDPYMVRVKLTPTGNQDGNQYMTVYPAGEAP
jgi:hypothetical protein